MMASGAVFSKGEHVSRATKRATAVSYVYISLFKRLIMDIPPLQLSLAFGAIMVSMEATEDLGSVLRNFPEKTEWK